MEPTSKIAVLCQYDFPVGMASTTRILSYCRGLEENGVETQVLTFAWHPKDAASPERGSVNGVEYRYTHSFSRARGKLYKNTVDRLKVYFNVFPVLREFSSEGGIDRVLLSFDSLAYLFLYVPLLRLTGYRLAFIGDEFPEPMRTRMDERLPVFRRLAYKLIYFLIPERIVMSDTLAEFYNREISPKPTHVLPSVIDSSRFTMSDSPFERSRSDVVTYMGAMDPTSDNVDLIIAAFARVSGNAELHLYGNPSEDVRRRLHGLAVESGVEGRVKFMGRIPSSEVPSVLEHSKVLVTSQPDNVRTRGGFPTKIGEYLASGTPALVTEVGDLRRHFQPDVHIFYAPKDDVEAYSNKLDYILTHYDQALSVAAAGRHLVQEKYDSKSQGAELMKFLR